MKPNDTKVVEVWNLGIERQTGLDEPERTGSTQDPVDLEPVEKTGL